MIFVVVEEVVPGSQRAGNTEFGHVQRHPWCCCYDDIGRSPGLQEAFKTNQGKPSSGIALDRIIGAPQ